jgi:hypothetical protein
MDRIIKGYVKDFSKQFGLEYNDNIINDLFEDFTTYCLLSYKLVNDTLDYDKIISTNTKKYKGIDNIAFIISGKIISNIKELEEIFENSGYVDVLLITIQSKTSESFNNSEVANLLDTFIDFLDEEPKYPLNEEAKNLHDMLMYILDNMAKINKFDTAIYYATTGHYNNDEIIQTTINEKKNLVSQKGIFKNGTIDIEIIDKNYLMKLFDKINRPSKAEFVFKEKTSISFDNDNIKEAYFGLLSFKDYKKILIDEESDKIRNLFYDNVRDNLGENEVNNDIDKTLKDKEFDYFPLLNNGVTIVAEKNLGSGNKFILENFQIVNGCQTSNKLYENRNLNGIDDLLIPIKLIITNDESLKNKITIATNNQTEIKEEQLVALTEFQKGLEEFYNLMSSEKPIKLYYERRANQYAGNTSIMKKSIIDLREQIKTFVAIFYEEPHNSSGYFGKIFKEYSKKLFISSHSYEPYYMCGLMQYIFKDFINKKQIDRKYNKARYHLFMIYRKIIETENFKETFLDQKKKIRKYSDEIIESLFDSEQALNNFKKSIELLEKTSINLDDQKEFYKKTSTNIILDKYKEEYK